MVAKSYQKFKIIGEPFADSASGRLYVKIKTNTGAEKKVRWYTQKEYDKMYPEESAVSRSTDRIRSRADVLGFEKGYITLIFGEVEKEEEWLCMSPARYSTICGWYFPSEATIPADIPAGLTRATLKKEAMFIDDNTLKTKYDIAIAIQKAKYPEQTMSKGISTPGERIAAYVNLIGKTETKNRYGGTDYVYTFKQLMSDDILEWHTSVQKYWEIGETLNILGTVKDHVATSVGVKTLLLRVKED